MIHVDLFFLGKQKLVLRFLRFHGIPRLRISEVDFIASRGRARTGDAMVIVRPGRWGAGMLTALSLLVAPGCAFYVAPGLWGRGGVTTSSAPPPMLVQNANHPAMMPVSNGMPPQNLADAIRSSTSVQPGTVQPGAVPMTMPPGTMVPSGVSPYEVVSLLQNRAVKSEEQMQAMNVRLSFLESKLKSEDAVLQTAKFEVDKTQTDTLKARSELTRLRSEIEELHNKMTKMQRDHHAVVHQLVAYLEGLRDQRNPKMPALSP